MQSHFLPGLPTVQIKSTAQESPHPYTVISLTSNKWKVTAELLTSDSVRKRRQMHRIQFSLLIDRRPSYEFISTIALVCQRSVCKHTCSCFERPWGIYTHRSRGHCALFHTLSGPGLLTLIQGYFPPPGRIQSSSSRTLHYLNEKNLVCGDVCPHTHTYQSLALSNHVDFNESSHGTQCVTGHQQGHVVTGQVMEAVSLTSHAWETLHYWRAARECVSVCVWESKQLSTLLACPLCHVSFPRCCNSVIVQGILRVCVCVRVRVFSLRCELFSAALFDYVALKHKVNR